VQILELIGLENDVKSVFMVEILLIQLMRSYYMVPVGHPANLRM
jgi:hypothetical protein